MSQNGPPASQVLSAAALCRGPALRLSDLVTVTGTATATVTVAAT
jgi:hypothetical protein